MAISVEIGIKTTPEGNQRKGWRTVWRNAKKQRNEAHRVLHLLAQEEPRLPCTVKMTRVSAGKLDGDNLQSALKHVRDGIADWLGVDDGDPRISWEYDQRRGPEKWYSVEVDIT
jgi:hypothetical protein